MIRTATAVALIAAALASTGATASAHSELEGSDPAPSAVLDTTPTAVTLTFNQRIAQQFATVSVMGGPADEQWVAQGVTVDGPTVRATLRPGLPAGQFTVGYRVVSADGHPITGSYGFTVTALAAPSPSAGAAALDTAAAPPPAPATADTKTDTDTGFPILWVLALAGVLIAAGLAVVLRGGRPKPRDR
ncbi:MULTISPECIES: copper resistance CopC family protein [Nocardia]|uniref:copper resistance CopC family protein n=1 Tax=Nocardia TaxID=1817 RepID=UPI000302FB4F|nr:MULTISPECIES: copper resistance CopC family protein [Nocardia]